MVSSAVAEQYSLAHSSLGIETTCITLLEAFQSALKCLGEGVNCYLQANFSSKCYISGNFFYCKAKFIEGYFLAVYLQYIMLN